MRKIKRRIGKHVWLTRFAILSFIFLALVLAGVLAVKLVPQEVKSFIFPNYSLINTQNDRTTILILGVGGKGHEAFDLTDTIMVASVSLTDNKVSLFSVPRDIWVPSIRAKINSSYHWGNFVLAKATVSEVVGMPINYAVLLDFQGFEKIIDAVDGVDVTVKNAFIDKKYPVAGREADPCLTCRYETIEFKQGVTHMNGVTALKFVRSRYAEGPEGTDLARSDRQQQVIKALTQKLLTTDILLSPEKIQTIIKVVESSIQTDIPASTLPILARKFFDSRQNLGSFAIPEELLVNPPISPKYDKQYVFLPRIGSWSEIHEWVKKILSN